MTIHLRLDSHGGEKERQHALLAQEFARRLWAAVEPVLRDPQFREIMTFDPEYYLGESGD